jgi:hypothetical protein
MFPKDQKERKQELRRTKKLKGLMWLKVRVSSLRLITTPNLNQEF